MAAASFSSSSSTHLLHHLFRYPKPSSLTNSSTSPFRSSCTFTSRYGPHYQKIRCKTSLDTCAFTSVSSPSNLVFSRSISSLRLSPVMANSMSSLREQTEEDYKQDIIEGGNEEGGHHGTLNASLETELESRGSEDINLENDDDNDDDRDSAEGLRSSDGVESQASGKKEMKPPSLTVKEKKELASYAHGLGKKLKCQLVGKSGVTDAVVSSFVETLEKNELLKIKIHETCPGELEDVVKHLEEATGSVVVGQIGRTVIIYRPSLSKLKAEEKRKHAQKVFMQRASKSNLVPMRKEASRPSGRGRRGASRV